MFSVFIDDAGPLKDKEHIGIHHRSSLTVGLSPVVDGNQERMS